MMKRLQNGVSMPLMVVIIAIFTIVGGFAYYRSSDDKTSQLSPLPNTETNLVGGDKDSHGCIGSAGYSWCAVKNKCVRPWEEKCETSAEK